MGYFGPAIPPVAIPVTTTRTPAVQEGRIIDSFLIEGTEARFRYPCWRDLDAFIDMHRTLSRERVMCRRLELDADSGGRELSQALVGLKQNRSSYLLVERDGVLMGEGFTQKSGHDYCTIGLALIALARGLGIGTRLMGALENESRRLGRAPAVPHRLVRQCLRGPRLPQSRLRRIRPPSGLGVDGLRRDLRPYRYGEDHRITAVSD